MSERFQKWKGDQAAKQIVNEKIQNEHKLKIISNMETL